MISSTQIREARRLLGWHSAKLAGEADVSVEAIRRAENTGMAAIADLTKLEAALEAAGVIFVGENGDGLGVRLREV